MMWTPVYLAVAAAGLLGASARMLVREEGPCPDNCDGSRLATFVAAKHEGPPHEKLSNREFEIMKLIASGKAVGEIARELSLSVKTVSTHRTRLLKKMEMKTNAELTSYAVRNRLVE